MHLLQSNFVSEKFYFSFFLVGFSTLLNYSYTQNCTKTPCLPNAKCEIRNGMEACYCNMGFSGNGVTICEGKQRLLALCGFIVRLNSNMITFLSSSKELLILFDFILLQIFFFQSTMISLNFPYQNFILNY